MEWAPDYYDVLGVAPDVDFETIDLAFKRLLKKWRTDKGSDDATKASCINLLNDAYEVLSKPETRLQYDLRRQRPASQGTNANVTAKPPLSLQKPSPTSISEKPTAHTTTSDFAEPIDEFADSERRTPRVRAAEAVQKYRAWLFEERSPWALWLTVGAAVAIIGVLLLGFVGVVVLAFTLTGRGNPSASEAPPIATHASQTTRSTDSRPFANAMPPASPNQYRGPPGGFPIPGGSSVPNSGVNNQGQLRPPQAPSLGPSAKDSPAGGLPLQNGDANNRKQPSSPPASSPSTTPPARNEQGEQLRKALSDITLNLKDKKAENRLHAVQAAGDLGEEARPIAREIVTAMTDNSTKVRMAASESLKKIRPDIHDSVVTILVDNQWWAAMKKLAELKDEGNDAVPAIVAFLSRQKLNDTNSIKFGLKTLIAVGENDETIAPTLMVYAGYKDWFVKDEAIAGLGILCEHCPTIRQKALRGFLNALDDPFPSTRLATIKALSKYGKEGRPALKKLEKLKLDSDEGIRKAAEAAYETIDKAE
jgi:hypothetical protein